MANAKRCDRCSRYYMIPKKEEDVVSIRQLSKHGCKVGDDIDLCKYCLDRFAQWMLTDKTEE